MATSTPARAKTLVFVHAHPDDEALLTAGTMARAAVEGHRVVLIVATNGEAGLTSAEMAANLGTLRQRELELSAAALGVHRVVTLDYPDSGLHGQVEEGFAHRHPRLIALRIAAILDEENADILVGYDPSGGYGHPDHLQVHRVSREAGGIARRSPVMFEATLPREPIVRAVRLATAARLTPGDWDSDEFEFAWTASAGITHRVNVRPHLGAKRAALLAHASQAGADGTIRTLAVLTRLPGPLATLLLGTEYFVRID